MCLFTAFKLTHTKEGVFPDNFFGGAGMAKHGSSVLIYVERYLKSYFSNYPF